MSTARHENFAYQEPWYCDLDHAALTANFNPVLEKVPVGKTLKIDRAFYVNHTGLAVDPTNDFSLVLKNGATTVASVFNTDSNDVPAGAALIANTPVDAVLSATPADSVLAGGSTLTAAFVLEGTQTLPPGRLRLVGRWL